MKTKKILALILILVGLGLSFKAEAQCDVVFSNTSGCNYVVIVFYTGGAGSTAPQNIPSIGGQVSVPIPDCSTVTSIDIYDGNGFNPVNLQPAGAINVNNSCTLSTSPATWTSQTTNYVYVDIF